MPGGNPTITVIVPVYNAAASLARCLESILAQTRPAGEIILVNDGSTDASVEVIRRYLDKVIYLEQENRGPAAARNAGLERAGGDLIAFLDADDYWEAEFLESCAGFLERHPEAAAVSAGQRIKTFGHGEVIRPALLAQTDPPPPREPVVLEDFFDFWSRHNHITVGSVVLRRDVVRRAGPMQSALRLCEDLEYWGYLATFGRWGFIPQILFVSDGAVAAAAQGWLRKHQARWATAPGVEEWQQRIAPRLGEKDWPGFRRMRGKVAKSSAHARIMAGRAAEARQIVRAYGRDFPRDYISRLMQWGAAAGVPGWWTATALLRGREWFKALLMRLTRPRA